MLFKRIAFAFSKYSAKNQVPKILQHPQFTREGINKKKVKSYQYDLEQPHIVNKNLYYNEKEAKQNQKLRRKQNKILNSPYELIETLDSERNPQIMLQELLDQDLLRQSSRRIINNILSLEKQKQIQEQGNLEIVRSALISLSISNLQSYNFRDFGIYTTQCERYLPNNAEVWEKISQNFIRYIKKQDYQEKQFTALTESIAKNIIYTYNNCTKQSQKLNLSTQTPLSNMTETYLLPNLTHIKDMNLRALFLSNIGRNIPKNSELKDQIQLTVFNEIKFSELNLQSLIAISHMLYKLDIQIAHKIVSQLDKALLKALHDKNVKVDQGKLAILVLSLGGISGDCNQLSQGLQKYITKSVQTDFTKLVDAGFVLEGLFKMKMLSSEVCQKLEPLVQKQASEASFRELLQILRANQGQVRLSEQCLASVAQRVDALHGTLSKKDKQFAYKLLKTALNAEQMEQLQNF